MTRARLPPGDVLQKAYGVLDKFKISRTFFVKTDQESCAVAASDLNAANGITSISTIPESFGTPQRKNNNDNNKIELTLDDDVTDSTKSSINKANPVPEVIYKAADVEANKAAEVETNKAEVEAEEVVKSDKEIEEIKTIPEKTVSN